MRISIVGSGYVGIVTGIGFAELGHDVIFVDVDENKVNLINSGKPPIYEKGLKELMQKNKGRYHATTDYDEAVNKSEITFICVGTPSKEDGSIDLRYVESASKGVGEALANKDDFHVVVVKSTVIPGTTEGVVKPLIEKESGKKAFKDFGLAMNPEFLREGNAVEDFFNPDRIVIGVKDEKTKSVLDELYKQFRCPKLFTDIKTAEMIKYASNAFLATKISFANEIGNICKKLGIDVYKVFEGVGLDHRINPAFFRAGIGFGGSCFPKDVKALIRKAEELGEDPKILKAVIEVNEKQPLKMIELLKKHIPNLANRKIGVLGLAFKPDTDDVRESRAIPIVEALLREEAKIIAYDPKAMNNFAKIFPQIEYAKSSQEVIDKSDAVLIVTEWREFEELDYSGKIVIDGRRIEKAMREAKIYEGVCW
ncbi:UDP-glucose dehydrogenase family protein [Archaeoglobus profundus]|uniref:UDP-glucose 6-dehydrogenase n=1 Tax=Archaeoglobus profundus (strain DSM 5631 / JCM 9629 / NBRC 100127 / Av18) TaxID=572546 RepID=D2RDS6_ARCPA|nr:UDP-glucose/GDP-mannose dehydrogenase family protein [Archaeoglobus profundus]ADB58270.1 nucleotide sugar dehydrogenase [Archaeoglobus profundus DSM 5631]